MMPLPPCRTCLFLVVALSLAGCVGAESPPPQAKAPDFQDHFDRGVDRQKVGRIREALGSFEKALALAPDHPDANHEVAGLLFLLGDSEKALVHASAAVANAAGPGSKEVYGVRRAKILNALGRTGEAAAALEQVIASDPRSRDAYPELCKSYLDLDEPAKVIETATKALDLDLDPGYPYYASVLLYYRGVAHLKKGDREGSHRDLREAIAVCVQFSKPFGALGESLVEAGKAEEAQPLLDRYAQLDRVRRGIDAAHQALVASDGKDPSRRRELISTYFLLERYRDAKAHCEVLRTAEPDNLEHWLTMGDIEFMLKEYRDAEKWFKQVIAKDPRRMPAYESLALLYATAEDESFRDLDAAWETVRQSRAYGVIGPETISEIYVQAGQRDRAIVTLRRAVLHAEGDITWIRRRIRELEAEEEAEEKTPGPGGEGGDPGGEAEDPTSEEETPKEEEDPEEE